MTRENQRLHSGQRSLGIAWGAGIYAAMTDDGSEPTQGEIDDMTAQEIIDSILGGVAETMLADPAHKIATDAQGRVGLATGSIASDTFAVGAIVPRVALVDTCTANADLWSPDAGTVSATSTPTTTTFKATGAGLHGASGFYTSGSFTMLLLFTSGGNNGKAAKITAHSVAGSVHTFTVSTLPTAPAAGDEFLILGGLPS